MARLATIPCVGCGAAVRSGGRWATCTSCSALRSRFLNRELAGCDPNAWVRGQNRVCGDKRVTAAVVAYERSQAA